MASDDVTELLAQWRDGSEEAFQRLVPLVHDELRRLARRHMRREPDGHLLQTTGLVNEAYLKLVDQTRVSWKNRAHFFGVAAQLMRRILVDHARSERADKRGGGVRPVGLTDLPIETPSRAADVLALDAALDTLGKLDPRQSKLVELRFFAGLTIDETAETLEISPATVKREWAVARAWLRREIGRAADITT